MTYTNRLHENTRRVVQAHCPFGTFGSWFVLGWGDVGGGDRYNVKVGSRWQILRRFRRAARLWSECGLPSRSSRERPGLARLRAKRFGGAAFA